jgi:hypothetical protein
MPPFVCFVSSGWQDIRRFRRRAKYWEPPCFDEIDRELLIAKCGEAEICEEHLGVVLPELDAVGGKIVGVLVLEFDHVSESTGSLAPSSLEWRFMGHFFGNNKSSLIFYRVLEAEAILDPGFLIADSGRRSVSPGSAADVSSREVLAAMTNECVGDQLGKLCVSGRLVKDIIADWLARYACINSVICNRAYPYTCRGKESLPTDIVGIGFLPRQGKPAYGYSWNWMF